MAYEFSDIFYAPFLYRKENWENGEKLYDKCGGGGSAFIK